MDELARLAYIYALIDPRTGEMRYIGSSTRPRRRLQDHLAAARAHHRLRSLGRTRWNEEPGYRRMRFAYRARMQWLYDLQQLGLQPRLLVLDTCSGLDSYGLRQAEARYIAAYWDRTRLFNGNCPASIEHFGHLRDLLARPAGLLSWDAKRALQALQQRKWEELEQQRQEAEQPCKEDGRRLSRCEERWHDAILRGRAVEEYSRTRLRQTVIRNREMRQSSSERTALEAKANAERAALATQQARMARTWARHDKSVLPPIATAAAVQGHAMVWQRDQDYRCTNARCRAWGNVVWPDDERWSGYSGPNRPCPFTHPNHYRGTRL